MALYLPSALQAISKEVRSRVQGAGAGMIWGPQTPGFRQTRSGAVKFGVTVKAEPWVYNLDARVVCEHVSSQVVAGALRLIEQQVEPSTGAALVPTTRPRRGRTGTTHARLNRTGKGLDRLKRFKVAGSAVKSQARIGLGTARPDQRMLGAIMKSNKTQSPIVPFWISGPNAETFRRALDQLVPHALNGTLRKEARSAPRTARSILLGG